MNQDEVKSILLKLDDDVPEFHVLFSGKSSRKVDGLYKPEIAQIIIHNRNFKSENSLIYTAIHEFAHHIQFSRAYGKVSARSHTTVFWDIFHRCLIDAEKKGIYHNIFKTEKEFKELTAKIKEKYLSANGELIKEFGGLLVSAMELCRSYDASFDDYMDREIGLHRNDAKSFMKTSVMNINPTMGYENMKIAARMPDPEMRTKVEKAFVNGMSPDMVKAEFFRKDSMSSGGTVEELLDQKKRINASIERLRIKLAEIDQKVSELRKAAEG